ncbi:MAG: Rv3235 family protein [Kineosporiaceae bacterium]
MVRVRPVPIVEPRPALRIVPDDPPDDADADGRPGGPGQEVLPLGGDAGGTSAVPAPGHRSRASAAAGPRDSAVQFTQAAVEVVTGLRPPAQLMGWTSDDVQGALQRRHALALHPGARPRRFRVRSVHVSTPVEGVAEVAAVVEDGARYRAVAFRMEGRERRWLVTAIDFG